MATSRARKTIHFMPQLTAQGPLEVDLAEPVSPAPSGIVIEEPIKPLTQAQKKAAQRKSVRLQLL